MGCHLTTTSAVYYTDLDLAGVEHAIRYRSLIEVRDDNDVRLYLNPMAVRTVSEDSANAR